MKKRKRLILNLIIVFTICFIFSLEYLGLVSALVTNSCNNNYTIGIYDPIKSNFYLRDNNNPNDTSRSNFTFGVSGWVPLVGDWDGDGNMTVGIYNPTNSKFYLRNTNNPSDPPTTDKVEFTFGSAGWIPLVGDWNGDGKTEIGIYNPTNSIFYLKDSNGPTDANKITITYGSPGAGWTPLVGDWNGDGKTEIGMYNPTNSTFYLKNNNNLNDKNKITITFGVPGWTPLVGDWDGDGNMTVGIYDPTNSKFYLRNTNNPNDPPATDKVELTFGVSGWTPIMGDWNNDKKTEIGIYNPTNSKFYLRNTNNPNDPPATDKVELTFGVSGWTPIMGVWGICPSIPIISENKSNNDSNSSICLNNNQCNDNNLCTIDSCSNGTCIYNKKQCDPGQGCNPNSGNCVKCITDLECNDGDSCTLDRCSNQTCTNTFVKNSLCNCKSDNDCNDNNICTDDKCTDNICVYDNNINSCNSTDKCIIESACSLGKCTGIQKNCDDGIICTTDTCSLGSCIHDTTDCSCTKDSDCNSNNICQDDICNLQIHKCTISYNNKICNDGNSNTKLDKCVGGKCVGQPICNENDVCDNGESCTNCPEDCGACGEKPISSGNEGLKAWMYIIIGILICAVVVMLIWFGRLLLKKYNSP